MEELTLACKAFLETEDAVVVDSSRKTVSLSKIFDWYREDFGKNNKEVTLILLLENSPSVDGSSLRHGEN